MINGVRSAVQKAGFTLIEILIAMTLLGLLTVMLFTSFNSVTRSWTVARKVCDASGHSDYIMEQLSAALRSAYTPGEGDEHGFTFTDDGEGPEARDVFEWTKVGPALIGEDVAFAQVPHRVRVYITDEEDDVPRGFAVRAWRQNLQLEEFDPELDSSYLVLSPKVQGMNCRMLDPTQATTEDDELNWIDTWEKESTLPSAVEVTLWLEPAEEGEEPIEYKRIIEIPMAALSQNPSSGSSATKAARSGTSEPVRGSGHFRPSSSSGGSSRPSNNRPSSRPNGGNGLFTPGGGGPPQPGM